MAAVKIKLGRIACPCCGHSILLKKNEAGTLTIQCDECDVSAFAKKGTGAAAKWLAQLPKPAPEPAPERVPKASSQEHDEDEEKAPLEPAPKPVPRILPKASPFDVLGSFGKGA